MLGIYLSGTGNTKHCIEKLIHLLDETAQAIPIEKKDAANELSQHDFIVLAYPVQFSNAPVMIRNFIKQHSAHWKGKKVLCVATMGLFSGDGAGCSARLLKKYGAKVVGGLHIHMPDSVCDVKLLKKPMENLVIESNKAVAKNRCTMCYRCISSCPQQAITLLGDTVVEQCRYVWRIKR